MKKITVITADIIDSRNKKFLGNELDRKLAALNHPKIISHFTVSRGDEIQGVVEGWLNAPEIIRNLRHICRPLLLKVGIGIGFLEARFIKKNSWLMNGPPFHLARTALETAKREKNSATVIKTGITEFDEFINCILLLLDTIQKGWSDKQWEAVQAYESRGTYEGASRDLGISMQNVQKRCRAANWKQVKYSENTLRTIQSYLEKNHPPKGDISKLTP